VIPSIEPIRRISAERLARHPEAWGWRDGVSTPVALVWLPREWALEPAQEELQERLLSHRTKRRVRAALRSGSRVKIMRAARAVSERFALHAAYAEMHSASYSLLPTPYSLYLVHTPLGRPVLCRRGPLAAWAREQGIKARHLYVSFTHDGDAHVAVMACAPGLRGLGVDAVHLPRLCRNGRDGGYLRRFARAFMAEEEYTAFLAASANEDEEALRRRVAAHFSLMEAASKALGTGLKIGGGIGHSASLPRASLGVARLNPAVRFALGAEAVARCAALGARRLEGHWGADGEYLLSVALLWE
jgi:phosphopantetheinyl transferase (holo-ACP synthase)